jgi:hypothetical protein
MKKPKKSDRNVMFSIGASLKQWTRKELEKWRENFDFDWVSQWPLHGLQMAWLWELERELGSRNPPFQTAWREKHEDAIPADERKPAVEFLPFREVLGEYPDAHEWNYLVGQFPRTIHAVKIDLECAKDEIIGDFWQHVEDLKKETGRWCRKKRKGERKSAGLNDYSAWFRDLSIYRLSRAGFRSKEQMNKLPQKMLGRLTMDFANWNHKRQATQKRIHKHLNDLQAYARIVSEDGNIKGSPHWFDHFIRL